jgi:putative ABC transport system permease protein
MAQDLLYAFRNLRKSPAFFVTAVVILALGVGANTAVFSLVNAVLLRPLPWPEPDRLVLVWESAPFFGLRDSPVSPANFVDWKARSRSFEEIGGLESAAFRLVGDGTPELVPGSVVSASTLRALRVPTLLGRIFREDEDRLGAPKVVVVSEGFWRRRLGADPGIIGKPITLNDEKRVVVGVIRAGFEPPAEYMPVAGEVWAPFGSEYSPRQWQERGRHNWMVIARLRPGVTLAQANAEMKGIGEALSREYPDTNEKVGAFVAPFREHFVDSSRRVLLILLGTVAVVLLIACSNLANLLLCRAANRTKEVAVRKALGAGTLQLIRQFLCESLILCAAGSVLGIVLATSTFDFLAHLAPGAMTGFKSLTVDWRVLVFSTAIAGITAVIFGLVPLLQVRRLDLSHSLKQTSRTLAGSGSSRLRATLVCSEVALAFVLLIGAGLLLQTFARLRAVNTGCRTKDLLTMQIWAREGLRTPAAITAYEREVLRKVSAIPGVASAGLTNHIPIAFKGDISGVGAEGHNATERFQCNARVAGPGYLRTMGIPLLRGRDVAETDIDGAPFVVMINEVLAQTLWPGQDPIGRRIIFETDVSAAVIGVVGNVHSSGPDVAPGPEFYISAYQAGYPVGALAVQTSVSPSALTQAVRDAVWSVNPNAPITDVATGEQILDREVFQRRVQTVLLAVFAGLALLLAIVGLYGVLAYLVGRQVPEIGVRMALGAAPSAELRRIVTHGLKLTAAGLAAGVIGALAATRLLTSILFEVKPSDPATYVMVAVVLVAAAVVASYLPARRAMGVDPITALRQE